MRAQNEMKIGGLGMESLYLHSVSLSLSVCSPLILLSVSHVLAPAKK